MRVSILMYLFVFLPDRWVFSDGSDVSGLYYDILKYIDPGRLDFIK